MKKIIISLLAPALLVAAASAHAVNYSVKNDMPPYSPTGSSQFTCDTTVLVTPCSLIRSSPAASVSPTKALISGQKIGKWVTANGRPAKTTTCDMYTVAAPAVGSTIMVSKLQPKNCVTR